MAIQLTTAAAPTVDAPTYRQLQADTGADFVGGADLVEKVQKENFLEFDVVLASQDMMGQVSKIARGSIGSIGSLRGRVPTRAPAPSTPRPTASEGCG